eukprot:4398994-Amphidinium_carterae.1
MGAVCWGIVYHHRAEQLLKCWACQGELLAGLPKTALTRLQVCAAQQVLWHQGLSTRVYAGFLALKVQLAIRALDELGRRLSPYGQPNIRSPQECSLEGVLSGQERVSRWDRRVRHVDPFWLARQQGLQNASAAYQEERLEPSHQFKLAPRLLVSATRTKC